MSRRFASALAVAGASACVAALALVGPASAATALPTLHVVISGTKGVSVSGSAVSGAVEVVSSTKGKPPSGPNSNGFDYGLVRLNPGVTIQQAVSAVQSHRGDINALTPYGGLVVDANAPSSVQTVLTPGNWVALNLSGNGNPGIAQFTVSRSSKPAALPKAKATQTAIEFTFRGPKVLRDGTIVRAQNHGWLVHMIELIGVRSKAGGETVMAYLKRGQDGKAQRLATGIVNLLGPASPGGMQQMVLHVKPRYYVEACFMDTLDGREHTQLGMERLIRVVK